MGLLSRLKSVFSKKDTTNKISIDSSPEELRKYIDAQYLEMYQRITSGEITDEEYENMKNVDRDLEEFKYYAGFDRTPSQEEMKVSSFLTHRAYEIELAEQNARVANQRQSANEIYRATLKHQAEMDAIMNGDDAKALRSNDLAFLNNMTNSSSKGKRSTNSNNTER